MRCTDFNAALLRSDLHLLSKSRRSKLPDGVNDHPCRKSVFRKSSTESSAQGESSARRSGRHIWFADANPRGVCPAERPRGIGPEKREPSERLNDTQPMATGQKKIPNGPRRHLTLAPGLLHRSHGNNAKRQAFTFARPQTAAFPSASGRSHPPPPSPAFLSPPLARPQSSP